MAALLLDPPMIPVMARCRPPGWFTDPGCLAIMGALVCVQGWPDLSVDMVVEALDRHGDLDLAGGRAGVAALVQPGPHLDAGRLELAVARETMPPLHEDPLVSFSLRLLHAWPEGHSPGP